LDENARVNTFHYDQTTSAQTSFAKDVYSLITNFEEVGNSLEEKKSGFVGS